MKIILDVMGSDKGTAEMLKGARLAKDELTVGIILVGDEAVIRKAADQNQLSIDDFEIVHASEVITMEDDPMSVRTKADSSMRVGFKLLNDKKGDAFVSCGNTGALHTGATLYVKRIRGVHRSAIGAILPMQKPLLLLDAGANLTITEEHMVQFGIMGSVYMEKLFGLQTAKVGLLNIGTEDHKGTQLCVDSYHALTDADLDFVGNIEGKDIPFGKCDVLVTDGFTGNILLKALEGMGSYIVTILKDMFTANFRTKASYLLMKDQVSGLKSKMSTSTYGGAPMLGISRPVIKAHGNSDAVAIKNAVRQAMTFVETGVVEEISRRCTAETMKGERIE